ncbi:MoaD/ThiS family protein [Calorimonas adulescens]|jgi:ThiS family.|uniref:MoaD/ThiS family protein n=1 Tax=Calorimonas adulescens TaxID=2606906 RepID=A0A5D8QBF9_9THEO|nr:MoaD/ThiS family protein [Calorimonas adulescens]TZE81474.1 MoaD/ThiS family protein [Calorimonas adulescens]
MVITVKFYSFYQNLAGKESIQVQMPDHSTLGDLLDTLKELFPQLFPEAEKALFIINQKAAVRESVLNDGDQVLMLAILSGG